MNEGNPGKEGLILAGIVSLVDRIFNPYSVIFGVTDVSREIIANLIKDTNDSNDSINTYWEVHGLVSYLRLLTFDISSMEQLGKVINLSENFRQIFRTGLNEVTEDVKKYLKHNFNLADFLFFDESSETIQIRDVNIWKETKKIIELKLDELKKGERHDHNDLEQMLTEELRVMYKHAPVGYQMAMVHLFGIKYDYQLDQVDLYKIAKAATGKNSLYVEVGKGKKLSRFVRLLNGEPKFNKKNNVKETREPIDSTSSDIIFYINQRQDGLKASGRYLGPGFLVQKGSEIRINKNYPKISRIVEVLIQKRIITLNQNKRIFSQDHLFSTPSGAACVIKGVNTNGWVAWKDNGGRSLMKVFSTRSIVKKHDKRVR